MKNIIYLVFGFSVVLFVNCSQSPNGEKVSTSVAQAAGKPSVFADYVLNKEESTIRWEGYKPTGKHFGTVSIVKGGLGINNGKLVGGEFVIDLNTIVCLDLENENFNKKLVNHLKSEDFFNVAEFPTANFKITEINPIETDQAKEMENGIVATHNITGNLTIRGITKSITFQAMIKQTSDAIIAKTNQFVLDRTEWGVNYNSKKIFDNLKDNFINDEMALTIELRADRV